MRHVLRHALTPAPALRRHLPAAASPALLCLVFVGAAAADDAGLQRCRAIAEPAARLACYDTLPLRQAPAAARAAVAPADEPVAISSHIPGQFEGWGPRTRFTLANGQVWQVADDSSGIYWLKEPKVTVRRAALGSFVMDIEGANRMPRVQRVD